VSNLGVTRPLLRKCREKALVTYPSNGHEITLVLYFLTPGCMDWTHRERGYKGQFIHPQFLNCSYATKGLQVEAVVLMPGKSKTNRNYSARSTTIPLQRERASSGGAGYSTRPERLNSTTIPDMPKSLRRGTYPVALRYQLNNK
jgi:hypothetical protein